MLGLPWGAVLLLVGLLVSYTTDPRKFRTGLYLLGFLVWVVLAATGLVLAFVEHRFDADVAARVLLVLLVIVLATVVALAGFLIVAGVTLLRREGWATSRLLSLALGLAMLAYVALGLGVLWTSSVQLAVAVLTAGLPVGYLGFGFVAFLLYGALYPAVMARRGGPVAAVVVLGSGLIGGRVPPLLASRLRRGRQLFERHAGTGARLVTSGGQGPDEPVAEAVAMAEFLLEEGVPADALLVEDRSRNTEENLANTAEVLRERGITGPIAAVTSDFHAFRAALLMRRLGLAGYAVGAPTARYYWPSAVIREFIAVLRDHLRLNAVLLALACVPLLWFSVGMLVYR